MVIAVGVPRCVAAVYIGAAARGVLLHDTHRAVADKVRIHPLRWSSGESLRRDSIGCRSLTSWSQQCQPLRKLKKFSTRASSASGDGREGDYDYDLVTIGAGSGGVRASRIAASFGVKVAICELPFAAVSSDSTGGVGGTCVLRGCVPKKILVMGSQFSHQFEESREFGWSYDSQPKHDWQTLVSNKNKELQRLIGVYKNILDRNDVTLIEGRGKVVDPHTVEIGGKNYTARHILVAVGGRASVPDIPGKEYVITSDHALDLPSRPEKICIVGGGYIALEFAGIFNGLGSEVHTFVRQDKVLRGFDDEIREFLAEQMAVRGIQFHFGESPTAVEKETDGKFKLVTTKGSYVADAVMFATGRSPNTKNLGLESVGVELDSKGAVKVDEYSRTNVDSIWAVGDVTNRLNLTPVAITEGIAFAKTAFGNQPTKPHHKFVSSAVFTQPPLASVGYTEADALTEFGDIDVFTTNFKPMKATISGISDRILMKLIVDVASDKVVGIHLCGDDSPEILQGFGVAVKAGLTKADIDSTVGIHPTAAEELVTMRSPTRKLRQKSSQQSEAEKVLSPH